MVWHEIGELARMHRNRMASIVGESERATEGSRASGMLIRLNDLADDGRLNPAVAMRKGYTHKCLRQQIRIFEQLRQRRSSWPAA